MCLCALIYMFLIYDNELQNSCDISESAKI